ncbi:MAG: hypothetical protein KAR20_11735, partial [Candidatus Heimdallarchaeota archaeon]|nr:hypothetical protein [Candidatus Heimdallarchaeota archaeon]
TEGGGGKGYGHIARCVGLAEAFKEKGILSEFLIDSEGAVSDIVFGIDYKQFAWHNDKEKVRHSIQDAKIVIVDSYYVDEKWCSFLADFVPLIVYFDDCGKIAYPRGLVINGSVGAKTIAYSQLENVQYLLGSRYQVVRRQFWDCGDRELRDTVKALMITFGGSDCREMVQKMVRMLEVAFPSLIKHIVLSKECSSFGESTHDTVRIHVGLDAYAMKKLMEESDIALSAGGQTVYEFACIGVPTIVVGTAENQKTNIRGWKKCGFISDEIWWDDPTLEEKILSEVKVLFDKQTRERRKKIGKEVMKYTGAREIIKEIERISESIISYK